MKKNNHPSLRAIFAALAMSMAAQPMAWGATSLKTGGPTANFITPLKAAQRAASRDLWGYMYYAKAWPTDSHQYGFMAFDAATASNFRDLRTESERNMLPNGGSSYFNGKYDLINYKKSGNSLLLTHYQFNTNKNWASVFAPETVNDMSLIATETATSQVSGKVYGQFYTPDMASFEFGVIDYDKMTRTTIAPSLHKYVAMGVTSQERVYGVATDGFLYEIDTQTGDEKMIGSTGVYVAPSSEQSYGQSGEIDQDDDTFYWASFDANQHGALYTVDLTTGLATLVADFPHNELIYGLAVPEATPADGAPAAPTAVSASFSDASTTGYVNISAPTKTYGGSTLSGQLTYSVRVGQKEVATGIISAGSTTQAKVSVEEGMNYFSVTLSNASGKSKPALTSAYVGYDVPKQASFARLKIDASGNATVTWGAPSAGQNGGYLGTLKYDVTRYPDGKKVAKSISATSFTDKIEGRRLQNYYYGVTPINGTQRGPERRTTAVRYGDNIETPYVEDFATQDAFDLFSTIDANSDGVTWDWDSETASAILSTSSKAADDWLVTPPVQLKAGHAYEVEFKAQKSLSYYNPSIEAYWGNAATKAALTNAFLTKTALPSTSLTTYKGEIRSSKDQLFYLGIHGVANAGEGRITIDDLTITDQGCLEGPDAVGDLTITPDATGALKARLSFRLSTKTVAGGNVSAITKVVVERDGEVVKEFGASTAGQLLTCDDNSPVAGFNNYTITAYTAAGAGRPATKTAYVGLDVPAVPTGVKSTDMSTGVQIDWDAASATGSNGGAVITKDVQFNVYRVRNVGGKLSQQLIGSTQGNSYTDNVDMTTGSQEICMYAVSGKNSKGESAMAATQALLSGKAYELPFTSNFVEDDEAPLWWSLTADTENNIGFVANTQTSSDGDNQSLVYTSANASRVVDINSGKIALAGASNPQVVFSHAATTGKNGKLEVYVKGTDLEQRLIGTIDYSKLSKAEDWQRSAFKIPAEYAAQRYVVLTFKAQSDVFGVVRLDDVTVRNVYDNDLAVQLAVPEQMKRGATSPVAITIANNGEKEAKGYTVSLAAGSNTVYEQTFDETLAPLTSKTVNVNVTSSPTDTGAELQLVARVDYAADQNTSDNTTTAAVKLVGSDIPQPKGLTAEKTASSITLSWTAPEAFSKRTTEDFESYDNWTVDAFGTWQTYTSKVGSTTGGWWGSMGMPFPHENEGYTYIIFNPDAIQDGITRQNSSIAPHSGEKCLMAMYSYDIVNKKAVYYDTDNWLISPMLSGKEQSLNFWANNAQPDMNNIRYPQTFEVWYSDKTTAHDDFKKLDTFTQKSGAWDIFTSKLPEGSLYFAIRWATGNDDAYCLLLDDIIYYRGYGRLKGYNVYCNGELVKTLDADATTATIDFDPTVWNNNVYSVTAVFDGGESEGATNDDCVVTGISGIGADGSTAKFDVYTVDGTLVKKGCTSTSELRKGVYVVGGRKFVKK